MKTFFDKNQPGVKLKPTYEKLMRGLLASKILKEELELKSKSDRIAQGLTDTNDFQNI